MTEGLADLKRLIEVLGGKRKRTDDDRGSDDEEREEGGPYAIAPSWRLLGMGGGVLHDAHLGVCVPIPHPPVHAPFHGSPATKAPTT